jgi:hypothetical protein
MPRTYTKAIIRLSQLGNTAFLLFTLGGCESATSLPRSLNAPPVSAVGVPTNPPPPGGNSYPYSPTPYQPRSTYYPISIISTAWPSSGHLYYKLPDGTLHGWGPFGSSFTDLVPYDICIFGLGSNDAGTCWDPSNLGRYPVYWTGGISNREPAERREYEQYYDAFRQQLRMKLKNTGFRLKCSACSRAAVIGVRG